MFGIEHPVIQGGMHYVGFAEMASAVANAGGLGIITGLTQKTPDDLAKEIAKCHEMTDKPFGVNLTFLPGFQEPDYPGYIKAIVEGGVKIVETAGRSPEAYMPDLKGAGIKVIHKCTSVRHSLKAEKIGCDAVSVDGFECGGHPGEDDIPNMILLPRAAEELSIPFVASGGMGNGQRVLANDAVQKILEKEKALGDEIQITDIIDEVAGVYPKIMQEGTMDAGAWSCGMVAGLIHDIPTCKELVERIVSDAEEIIKSRLSQFVA